MVDVMSIVVLIVMLMVLVLVLLGCDAGGKTGCVDAGMVVVD